MNQKDQSEEENSSGCDLSLYVLRLTFSHWETESQTNKIKKLKTRYLYTGNSYTSVSYGSAARGSVSELVHFVNVFCAAN